jgi:hypothetical protein
MNAAPRWTGLKAAVVGLVLAPLAALAQVFCNPGIPIALNSPSFTPSGTNEKL